MKRTRLIPSILMLVACIAIFGVGIYAITPSQNNVTGTISVIASNVEFEITAYLNSQSGTKLSDTVTSRTNTTINIYNDKLEFDGVEASSVDDVDDIKLVLAIKNKSASKSIGAFFLKDAVLPETITTANIASMLSFDGKTADNSKTETDLITATFQGYTQIAAGATVEVVCMLSLNKFTDYDMNVNFNLPLVIHDYNSSLQSKSISLLSKIGESEGGSDISVTSSGSGAYNVGDSVTLTASTSQVTSGYICVYKWYAKNTLGNWIEVTDGDSDDSSYTFTITETSPTEYKVVCKSEKKPYIISLIYEYDTNSLNSDKQVLSGAGTKKLGDEVTLTISGPAIHGMTNWNVAWYKKVNGSWVLITSKAVLPAWAQGGPDPDPWTDSYTFTIEEDTPLEYKVYTYVNVGGLGWE